MEPIEQTRQESTNVHKKVRSKDQEQKPHSSLVLAQASKAAAAPQRWCVDQQSCPAKSARAGDKPPAPAPIQAIRGHPEAHAPCHAPLDWSARSVPCAPRRAVLGPQEWLSLKADSRLRRVRGHIPATMLSPRHSLDWVGKPRGARSAALEDCPTPMLGTTS